MLGATRLLASPCGKDLPSECHPEQCDCLRPLAGRICPPNVILSKAKDLSVYCQILRNPCKKTQGQERLRMTNDSSSRAKRGDLSFIHHREQTRQSLLRHCHPEQSDCLRPLAGRIFLLIIRFFATLVKRHKGRRGSEGQKIRHRERSAAIPTPTVIASEAWRSLLRHCHPERSDCLRPLAGRVCLPIVILSEAKDLSINH